jgi:hypothetical protein
MNVAIIHINFIFIRFDAILSQQKITYITEIYHEQTIIVYQFRHIYCSH